MALTSSLPVERSGFPLGAQRPRICHVPEYVSTSGEEAVDLAALAGLRLDDWQRWVLGHALGERADGRWAAQTVGLTVGRQNGKGSILEARELFGLFILHEQLIIHTAHQQKTATNHYRRLLKLIRRIPEFEKRVARAPSGNGREAIELVTGEMIIFPTRAGGGGRGLTADVVVFDEAMFLTEEDRGDIVPTMAAQSMEGNPQIWYAGSAVDENEHNGIPFTRVRAAGMEGQSGTAYFEWSAPGDDPERVPAHVAADVETQRLANPGLGIRISHEWVEHERTVEMGPRAFAIERLGIGAWPDITEDSGRVIASAVWALGAERDSTNRIVGDRAYAIDVNPDRSWGSIGIAGRRGDGLWQFAITDRHRRTDWIVGRCVELHGESPGPFVLLARGPAANMAAALRDEGLDVIEVSGAEYGQACSDFFDVVHDLRHDGRPAVRYPFPQTDLDEALSGARRNGSQQENAWTWSRKASTSPDISPLVAVTLALWRAMSGESEYATVLLPNRLSPEEQVEREREELGPQAPVVLTPEDYTTCFRCATGSPCPEHKGA